MDFVHRNMWWWFSITRPIYCLTPTEWWCSCRLPLPTLVAMEFVHRNMWWWYSSTLPIYRLTTTEWWCSM